MYPDLSYLLHDIFGTSVDNAASLVKSFGLFLAIAFIGSAYVLYLELKRKAAEGILKPTPTVVIEGVPATMMQLLSNALLGFAMGFKGVYIIQNYATITDPMSALANMQGNIWAGIAGAVLFVGIKWYENYGKTPTQRTVNLFPHDRTGDITMIAAVTGIIGAKIFAFFESVGSMNSFLADPFGSFFSGSGLAIYGGLIGGTIGVSWYTLRNKIPIRAMADAVAPALMMGYALGRLGCHVSGDGDWGIAAAAQPSWWFLPDWLWAYDYPHNVSNFIDATGRAHFHPNAQLIEGFQGRYAAHLVPPVYPTPIYEIILSLLTFWLMWRVRRIVRPAGMMMSLYLIFNGVERFFIEKIRVNDKIDAFGLHFTQAEFISVLFVIFGIIGVILLRREAKNKDNHLGVSAA